MTTKLEPATFFQLIADPTEKMKLLYDLADGQRHVLCKALEAGSTPFIAEAVTVIGSYLMARPDKLPSIAEDSDLIVQFQLGNQKYIAQVPAEKRHDMLALQMSRKLFRVQRREFYRLKLPPTFRGVLQIEELDGVPFRQSFHLVDLSGGGCKIELPMIDVDFKSGVPFQGTLKIPKREDYSVKCIVRHQNRIAHQPEVRWIGVQFLDMRAADINRMAALVMDLHREFFARI